MQLKKGIPDPLVLFVVLAVFFVRDKRLHIVQQLRLADVRERHAVEDSVELPVPGIRRLEQGKRLFHVLGCVCRMADSDFARVV